MAKGTIIEKEDGEREEVQEDQFRIIPEHQCVGEATALARDLEEVDLPGIHGTSYKIVRDTPYCGHHQKAGTIRFLDGRESPHGIMSIADDSGVRGPKNKR